MNVKLLILLFLVIGLLFTAACSKEADKQESEQEEQPETGITDIFEEPDEEITPPAPPPT
jgi:hypothetical protein